MTTASAPGKIILFGEHSVVYQRPALAVPVSQVHADVEINAAQAGIWIDAPDSSLHASLATLLPDHALRSIIDSVLLALGNTSPPALNICITSNIPVASGLGSGAAVSVALIRALSAHLGAPMPAEQVNKLCYEIEKIHHGTPSGIDNTVITYTCPVFFTKGQPIETFQVKSPFTIIIADTGIPAPTKESVGAVSKLWQADPRHWNQVFDQIAAIVQQGRLAIESGSWQDLGPLMDSNHALLQEMTVSSTELDRLVLAAKAAGAKGAKLSGGGRGGNMIALAGSEPETAEQIACALRDAGARHTLITTVQ
jgi:mevalonate kinase